MEIHGTNDEVTLWKGDYENSFWGAYLSQQDLVKFWKSGLGLDEYERTKKSSGKIIQHRYWTRCDNTEFRHVEIQGFGHDWPSNIGNSHSTALVIWKFF